MAATNGVNEIYVFLSDCGKGVCVIYWSVKRDNVSLLATK